MPIPCMDDLYNNALGRNLTHEEILDLQLEADKLAKQAKAAMQAAGTYPDIAAWTAQYQNQKQLAAVAKRRLTFLNRAAEYNAKNMIMTNFADRAWEGLSALMVGSERSKDGARLSVDSLRTSYFNRVAAGLLNDLEELNPAYLKLLKDSTMDREIVNALYELGQPVPNFQGNPVALEIAKIIDKWKEIIRTDENLAGAWINKLPGHIVRQSHDSAKIFKAGQAEWMTLTNQLLDWTKTADGRLANATQQERETFLAHCYQSLVDGYHEAYAPPGIQPHSNPVYSASNMGSLASKLSHERVLHFKNGDAWYQYNERFGRGKMIDALLYSMRKSANDIALMKVFGPSPQDMLEKLIKDFKEIYHHNGNTAAMKTLDSWSKKQARLWNEMKELDGSVNIEGNPSWAQVGSFLRAMQSMAKLGAATISGFGDVPLVGLEMKYQGRGFFKSLAEGFYHFARSIRKNYGSLEERKVLGQCGVFFDSIVGDIVSRFTGNDAPGKVSAAMNLFFKYSGLTGWTNAWKKSVCLMMSHGLALEKNNAFAQLSKPQQRVLSLYKIDAEIWDMLRKHQMIAADGREYFTPELAQNIDSAEIANYFKAKGMIFHPSQVDQFRETIAGRLRAYFKDRVQHAVLEPDARTGALMHFGTSSGTIPGELFRFAMQFKSFPIVYLQRALGREIYGRGAETLGRGLLQMIKPINNERNALFELLVATTLFGYLSMTTKQMLNNRTYRNPFESKEQFYNVLIASLAQGGGLGIMGDFMFGARSRMGDDFLSTLGGPMLGTASSLVDIYKRLRDGDDLKASGYRLLYSNLPFNNIFWLKPGIDYMFNYSMYEFLNPGSLKRMRQRMRKENNQDFRYTPHIWDWAKPGKRKNNTTLKY